MAFDRLQVIEWLNAKMSVISVVTGNSSDGQGADN